MWPFRKKRPVDDGMNYLVVGLGNIGAEYAGTRHNMGFMVLDSWVQESNTLFNSERYGSVAVLPFRGRKLYLLKPSTYMNLSGNAVRYWVNKLKLPLERLVIICDDLNLPFGTIRMRTSGSDGGHNGLKHIQMMLGTEAYTRIRMGIGNDYHHGEQVDFVLSPLTDEQRAMMPELCKKVIAGVQEYCISGPQKAMMTLNSSKNAV